MPALANKNQPNFKAENRLMYSVNFIRTQEYYQLPKFLFYKMFDGISHNERVAYALLKDRHGLSIKNGWYDKNGNVYCIYTNKELQQILKLSDKTVTKALKTLVEHNLLYIKRQGAMKPNLIYLLYPENVFDPQENEETDYEAAENTQNPSTADNPCAEVNRKNYDSCIVKTTIHESEKVRHSNNDSLINNTSVIIESSHVVSTATQPTLEEIKNGQDEDTDIDTTGTKNNSLPVNTPPQTAAVKKAKKIVPPKPPMSSKRREETNKYDLELYSKYKSIIQENISYAYADHRDIEFIDGLVEIMLDVICTESPTIVMGGETKSREIVRSTYLKLNSDHIEYVIDRFSEQGHEIKQKNAYLRKMLFTAYHELDAHYHNEVRFTGAVAPNRYRKKAI